MTVRQLADMRDRLTPIYKMGCDDWHESAHLKPCVFGSAGATHTVLLAGDSVVMQWFPAVRQVFDRPGWRLVVLTKSSCPMVDADVYYKPAGGLYTNCTEWRSRVLRWVGTNRPDVVITGSANSYEFSAEEWLAGTRSVMTTAAADTGHLFLLRSTPMLRPSGMKAFDDVYGLEVQALRRIENATPVDMNPSACPRGECSKRAFRDQRHLSPEFTASLAETLASRLSSQ